MVAVFSSSFQPKSDYSLTVLNPSEDVSINVYIQLYLSSCQYYDPVSQHWVSEGCEVGDRSTPQVTVCMCNHLTSFGASALVPLDSIDFADLAVCIKVIVCIYVYTDSILKIP